MVLQEGFSESLVLPIERMSYNQPEQTFILLEREPNSLEFGSITPTLRFTVKEIDPSTGIESYFLLRILMTDLPLHNLCLCFS